MAPLPCLLKIEPWVTLYHWDLPNDLEERGGWTNREIIHWFADYVQTCVDHFGDRVKRWMVLNEPFVFTGAGYEIIDSQVKPKRVVHSILPPLKSYFFFQFPRSPFEGIERKNKILNPRWLQEKPWEKGRAVPG